MTVAAILDAGAAAGAGLGSGAGVLSGAGTSGPISLPRGLGFGAQKAGALGAGSGGVGANGTQAGIARSATGAEQGARSLGIASRWPGQPVTNNENFRAQWELAVSEQSSGTETPAEEKSTAPPEIADGFHARSFLGNAAEATLSKPNGTSVNGATITAAGRMQPPTQNEATVSAAEDSATQSEIVTATAAKGSKTRDGVTAKNAEHNLPAKDTGAQTGAGNPLMPAMAAVQPAPMAPEVGSAREMPSNGGGGAAGAALHLAAKNFPLTSGPSEVSPSVTPHAVATNFTAEGDTAEDAANAAPRTVAMQFPLSGDFAEARTNVATHAVATHSAPSEKSAETATNASSGGTRASMDTAVAPQQSEQEVAAAGSAQNLVSSSPGYVSGQDMAAAEPKSETQKVQSGLQSGIRSRATVQGGNALAAATTSEAANASSGEGSKVDANGFDTTPGRQKSVTAISVGSGSIGSGSAPAAIMHSAQAINPGSDPSGLVRVAVGGEGGSSLTANHAGAGGNAAGQAPVGNAGATFAALDAGTGVGVPGWIHTSSQRAEAGFEDPVLGWVGVRADVVSGTVHAAILPGSAEAAAALSTHLTGLGTYLSEQHATVSAVTVAAPAQQGIESGVGQNLQQSAQQNSGEDTRGTRETQEQAGGAAVSGAALRSGAVDISAMTPMDSLGGMRGTNISVMV
jgi:hypothetical protein